MLKFCNILGKITLVWGLASWLDVIALNGVDLSWNMFSILLKIF